MTNVNTFINPPEVRIPVTLQQSAESNYYQSTSTVLYQLWDALRKLGTSSSSIINNTDIEESFVVACSDETTALTAGTKKAVFRMPYNFTLTDVRASVTTAATGTTLLTVDIGQNDTSILLTKLTFDSGEKTTYTAATPAVTTVAALNNDDEIRIDILSVGSTIAGAGLKVTLAGFKTKP